MNYQHMGKSQDAMSWLNYWIQERERVREMKEGYVKEKEGFWLPPMPKPWSQDPIFQTTYFCNVRREDDKVTRWIRQNWTMAEWEDCYDYAIVLARFLNNIPTLEYLLPRKLACIRTHELQNLLEQRAQQDLQVWGGAYVVTSHGLRMPKVAYLCQRVLPAAHTELVGQRKLWGPSPSGPPTLAGAHALLMQLEGLGSFMAAQVVADLKNTKGHPLQRAEDWHDWSAPGPGSLRGLGWVFGKKISPAQYQESMGKVLFEMPYEIRNIFMDNMQDLQNCLCEFDKFMRVMTKTGKSKRKYNGK